MGDGGDDGTVQPCLFLLFAPGSRPTVSDVEAALTMAGIGRISHIPSKPGGGAWLELLSDGLTFDLLGLDPGHSLVLPDLNHTFGISSVRVWKYEAIGLAPGPHLAGAHSALPVVRTLLRLGVALVSHWPDTVGAVWHPARSAMARDHFLKTTIDWLAGGAFPALGLTGVVEKLDGSMASDGLSFFTGQELVLDAALNSDRVTATRLLVRLIDAMVEQGPLTGPEKVTLTDGTCLCLTPAGTEIKVSRV